MYHTQQCSLDVHCKTARTTLTCEDMRKKKPLTNMISAAPYRIHLCKEEKKNLSKMTSIFNYSTTDKFRNAGRPQYSSFIFTETSTWVYVCASVALFKKIWMRQDALDCSNGIHALHALRALVLHQTYHLLVKEYILRNTSYWLQVHWCIHTVKLSYITVYMNNSWGVPGIFFSFFGGA